MIDVDRALLQRAKVDGGFDTNKAIKSFCQMFNMSESDVTPEKLNAMFKKMYYGPVKRPFTEVTAENKGQAVVDFLTDVEKIFNNDPGCNKFVYSDGEKCQGIKIKEPKQPGLWMKFAHFVFGAYKEEFDEVSPEGIERRNAINHSDAVTTSQTHADMMSGVKRSELKITAYQKILKELENPKRSFEDKKIIANKLAIYNYAQNKLPNGRRNDIVMFTDINPEDLTFEEMFGENEEIGKAFKAHPKGIFTQPDRIQTRTNLAAAIMLADNPDMTFEEAFSNNHSFDAKKREAGRELQRIVAEQDMDALLTRLSKIGDRLNSITFPTKASSMSDKLAFLVNNEAKISFCQDLLQMNINGQLFTDTMNTFDEEKRASVNSALKVCQNFVNYERVCGSLPKNLITNIDGVLNKNPLDDKIVIGNFATFDTGTNIFAGKKASELDKDKLLRAATMQMLVVPQVEDIVEGQDPEKREYAGKINAYMAQEIVKGLNLDAKQSILDTYTYIGKNAPDLNQYDFRAQTPFTEKYFEMNMIGISTFNMQLQQLGAEPFENVPNQQRNFNSNADLGKAIGGDMAKENEFIPVSNKIDENQIAIDRGEIKVHD